MKAKRSLSQCFLQSSHYQEKIASYIPTKEEDIILEIGPGKGALTKFLYFQKWEKLVLVEKDNQLIPYLKTQYPNATLLHQDALAFDFQSLGPKKAIVISNLPYNITQKFLYKLCESFTFLQEALLLLQKEVVEKITSSKFLLGAYVSFVAKITPLWIISKKHFSPQPKVDSQVVHLKFFPSTKVAPSRFFPFLQKLYQEKRKTLYRSLRSTYSEEAVERAFTTLQITRMARVEELSSSLLETIYLFLTQKNS